VNVDWKDGPIEGEEQCASDGLRTDAFETREKLFGLFESRGLKKRKIKRAATLMNFVKQLLYST
jgi:hypothetical protein